MINFTVKNLQKKAIRNKNKLICLQKILKQFKLRMLKILFINFFKLQILSNIKDKKKWMKGPIKYLKKKKCKKNKLLQKNGLMKMYNNLQRESLNSQQEQLIDGK